MRRNWFAAILAIAVFAGALVASGCASAATKPPAAAATSSARAAAAAGGTANIMIYGVNTDGAYWHAIVSGVIGDYGPAVSIYPDGQVDPAHNSQMALRLTGGSFRLSIAALIKAFVTAASHEPIYPKTCTDLITVTGTTPIVAGSGTGAYYGIRGGFPVTLTLNEVEARPCQPSPGAFGAQLITVAGTGTISFCWAHRPFSQLVSGATTTPVQQTGRGGR
jgi:hypothetical protein